MKLYVINELYVMDCVRKLESGRIHSLRSYGAKIRLGEFKAEYFKYFLSYIAIGPTSHDDNVHTEIKKDNFNI